MPQDEVARVRESNKLYLKLDEFQIILHEAIMQMPVNTYPKSLTDYIKKESDKYMYCGDLHAVCVARWVRRCMESLEIIGEINHLIDDRGLEDATR